MVREHGGDGEIVVPPTIHALLQARIDSLDGDVRVVMERGSVEGEVFHRGAVAELSPDLVRPAVESHLATLVRKELIRSTSPTFPEDEGFRFRHLLIRDAAYESLPKATRAELHERFADWLVAARPRRARRDRRLPPRAGASLPVRARSGRLARSRELAERAADASGARRARRHGSWRLGCGAHAAAPRPTTPAGGLGRARGARARACARAVGDRRDATRPPRSRAEATSARRSRPPSARDRRRGRHRIASTAGPTADDARARRDEARPVLEAADDHQGLGVLLAFRRLRLLGALSSDSRPQRRGSAVPHHALTGGVERLAHRPRRPTF